jgi:hypothetical protein
MMRAHRTAPAGQHAAAQVAGNDVLVMDCVVDNAPFIPDGVMYRPHCVL